MRLLLVRHGETVDNVAGNYAGITDSALTNHGVLQAQRLGAYLSTTGINTAAIFSSDLQRAFKTAEAIRLAQPPNAAPVTKLSILREQDFGFYEGKRFYERPKDSSGKSGKDAHLAAHRNDPGFVDVESKEAMALRAETFVQEHLLDLISSVSDVQMVVVVAHGIILNHLWRAILRCFPSSKVSMVAGVGGAERGLEYLGGWSNTGYLDLEVKSDNTEHPTLLANVVAQTEELHEETPKPSVPAPSTSATTSSTPIPPPAKAQLTSPGKSSSLSKHKIMDKMLMIKAINSLEHLKGLKKARGGTGSLKHDSNQKTMDSFFKKRKTE